MKNLIRILMLAAVAQGALAHDEEHKGEPSPIYRRPVLDKCELILLGECYQTYFPSVCTVKKPALEGSGTNQCWAYQSIRYQACHKGLSYEEIQKLEVTCKVRDDFQVIPKPGKK